MRWSGCTSRSKGVSLRGGNEAWGGWCSHKIARVPSRPGPPCKAATGLCQPAPPRPASRGRCARRTVSSGGRSSVAQPGPWRPAESQAAVTSPRPRAPTPISFPQTTWRAAGWLSGWQRGVSAWRRYEAGSGLLRAGGTASRGRGGGDTTRVPRCHTQARAPAWPGRPWNFLSPWHLPNLMKV